MLRGILRSGACGQHFGFSGHLIGGTAIGTVLILVFIPALYAIWFAVKPTAKVTEADRPTQKGRSLGASAPIVASPAREFPPDTPMTQPQMAEPTAHVAIPQRAAE